MAKLTDAPCAQEIAEAVTALQSCRLPNLAMLLRRVAYQLDTLKGIGDFQSRVQPWLLECFSMEVCRDKLERNHRFLEEALELVQSLNCPKEDAHKLVDYVYGRSAGQPVQEVGGVMVTLAALCLASGMNMHIAGEVELNRIWGKIDDIRRKQAGKPAHSPLPE